MKHLLPLLFLGFLLCSCHRRESGVSASFDFHTSSPEKEASFQTEFQAFLTTNGFKPCPPPAILSKGGSNNPDQQSVWMEGTFRGSEPFYLHYQFGVGQQSFSAHGSTAWDVRGNDQKISVTRTAVQVFSQELAKIAARHRSPKSGLESPLSEMPPVTP